MRDGVGSHLQGRAGLLQLVAAGRPVLYKAESAWRAFLHWVPVSVVRLSWHVWIECSSAFCTLLWQVAWIDWMIGLMRMDTYTPLATATHVHMPAANTDQAVASFLTSAIYEFLDRFTL
jgi:hypothetical protein